MTTGAFWNVENPLKPWGLFDPDDVIIIPYDFSEWLAEQETTLLTQDISPDSNLAATLVESPSGGIVKVRVSKAPGGTLQAGYKYGVTVQITCADTQKRSKTLYLKIKEL